MSQHERAWDALLAQRVRPLGSDGAALATDSIRRSGGPPNAPATVTDVEALQDWVATEVRDCLRSISAVMRNTSRMFIRCLAVMVALSCLVVVVARLAYG